MTAILRYIGVLAGLALGVTWVIGAPGLVSQIAGFAAFAALGSTFLVVGAWKHRWVEILGVTGALMAFMAPEGLLPGILLGLPATAAIVMRAWRKLQLQVVKNAKGGVKGG